MYKIFSLISPTKFKKSSLKIDNLIIKFSIGFFISILLCKLVTLVGIINSGDYNRLILPLGINYLKCTIYTDTCINYAFSNFKIINSVYFISSTSYFIFLSLILNKLFNSFDGTYSIMILSLLNACVYCVGFYFLIKYFIKNLKLIPAIILISFIVILLCDNLFIQYFNSFYQESTFIVTMLLFCAIFLSGRNFFFELIIILIVALTKQQNLIFLFLTIPILIKYRYFIKNKFKFKFFHIILCFLIIFLPFKLFTENSKQFGCMNTLNGFFDGYLYGVSKNKLINYLNQAQTNTQYSIYANTAVWGNNISFNRMHQKRIIDSAELPQLCSSIKSNNILLGYWYNPKKLFKNIYAYIKILDTYGPFDPIYYSENSKFIIKKSILINILHYSFYCLGISFLISLFFIKKIINGQINIDYLLFISLTFLLPLIIITDFIGDGFADAIKHGLEYYFVISCQIIIIIYIGLNSLNNVFKQIKINGK